MKVAESEEDFERATPRPEPAVPTNVSDARFRFFMMVCALGASFCAGASLYFLGTKPVPGVKVPVNAWMGAGVALTLVLAWIVLARLSPKLGYSKPGQGRWARLSAYVGFAVIALFGAVALHGLPAYGSKWFGGDFPLWQTKVLGRLFTLRPIFFPAAGFFMGAMVAFHLFINRPPAAEFLVETQGEMKRVSWPTRREWIGSTLVVLVLVFVLSMFLYAVDSWVLSPLMQKLRIGF